jgi:hypothetical protein
MLGLNVKRGVETTLERVFNNGGERFDNLEINWTGTTAGIIFKRSGTYTSARVIFPAIDETANIENGKFNNLIGYALHELGHAWFTDSAPWDNARTKHGHFVNGLINGLEDPRIEQAVIDSGRAPNSKALFNNLINSVTSKEYIQADDRKNIPFLLAVEGRRLNGYHINVPNIVDDAPWSADLHWALNKAHLATSTKEIVKIALALFKRLQKHQPPKHSDEGNDQGEDQGKDQGNDQPQGDQPQGNQPSDQPSDDQGGDQPSDQPVDEPSDKGSDAGGDDAGDDADDDASDAGDVGDDAGDTDGDKPSDKPSDGWSDEDTAGGKEVEPSDFIQDELKEHASEADALRPRPIVGNPVIRTFNWS